MFLKRVESNETKVGSKHEYDGLVNTVFGPLAVCRDVKQLWPEQNGSFVAISWDREFTEVAI